MSGFNRLRWHSRRGMLELDIVLARFWKKFGDTLGVEEQAELEKLLEYEDADLLELILGSDASEATSRVLQMLRTDM
jgi:antitoxin CptB